MSLKISLDGANALWLPAECARSMQISVVIELDERLERDLEAFAVVEDGAMMIGNPPRPRIEIILMPFKSPLARLVTYCGETKMSALEG